MDQRGVSLVELLTAVAIIAIVMIVVGIEFPTWQAKYKFEAEVKKMKADLMKARSRAMQRDRTYIVRLNPATDKTYTVFEDMNGDNRWDAGDQLVPDLSDTNLDYRMRWSWGGGAYDVIMQRRGLIDVQLPGPAGGAGPGGPGDFTIWLINAEGRRWILPDSPPAPENPYSGQEVDFDCLTLVATRIYVGKLDNGGACVIK